MKADSRPSEDSFGWPAHLPAVIRAPLRLGALIPWTVLVYLFFLAGKAPARLAHQGRRRWRYFAFRHWSRGMQSIFGMRVHLSGRPPQPPFVLVSNHLSYVDILLLAGHLDCVFVAKADIDRWPFINWLCRSVDTLFVDRTLRKDVVRVNRLVSDRLQEATGIIFFPEATSTDGSRVRPFKPSLLQAAVDAGVPVHYCALSYRTPEDSPPASLVVCWWGPMPLPSHLMRMLSLPGFDAYLDFAPQPLSGSDRKDMARRLQQGVSELFRPVRQPGNPEGETA
ncbi:MAG TPA: lysophospholipid acyltransferase family protein [Acidobacteriota bacterium]|nr:lysophospholipid acyltransferase family protein [Acidobacteriota bacterium]